MKPKRQKSFAPAAQSISAEDMDANTVLQASEPVLTEEGQSFFARHVTMLTLVPWFLLRIWNTYFLGPNQDVQRYFDASGQWLKGLIPYYQFHIEYPPGALLLFVGPRYFSDKYETFSRLFALEMLAFDVLALWLIGRLAARLSPKSLLAPRIGYVKCIALMTYVSLSGMLGYLAFERYDLAFAVLILGFVYLAIAPKTRLLASFVLATTIWLKLMSVVLIPLYFLYLAQDHAGDDDGAGGAKTQPWATKISLWLKDGGWQDVLAVFAPLAFMFVPFWMAAGDSFFDFVRYHSERGLQIESMFSSLLLALHAVFNLSVATRFIYGATEITHSTSEFLAKGTGVLMAGVIVAQLFALAKDLRIVKDSHSRRSILMRGVVAHMLALIAVNKVYSPQYMLWMAPLMPCLLFSCKKQARHQVFCFGIANVITGLILFFYYVNLLHLEAFAVSLLLLRNAIVVALSLSLVDLGFSSEAPEPSDTWPYAPAASGLRRAVTWTQNIGATHAMGVFALGLCAFWIFAANLSETTANDIWIQLKSGEEIFRTHAIPYTEIYSATVSGRPFIAHEWLSGVLFYVSSLILGDAGLSILTAFVAFGIFWCMYYTFEKQKRQAYWYLPLLIYLNYLVAFRLLARPHIFTILAQAMFLMAIERWRRDGRARQLLWLLPVQIVWINLHGGALFGPALMAMVAGCMCVSCLFERLQHHNESRQITFDDVLVLGGMAVALTLACAVNPYGIKIFGFGADLFGNEYAKTRVWEWTTPFMESNAGYYWLWIYLVCLSVLWASLLVRIKQLPILDIAYTVLATYLGIRANRFMPDFALLSFPVIARSMHVLSTVALRPKLRVQMPWIEISACTLLLCNCFIYGYAHSPREHRPLFGWGYGGDMPFVEVDLLKKLGIKGIIYNEYSDGSLIINKLWPDIRPVLDSRIDLYPLDLVNDYDRAYVVPQLFAQYLKRHNCNIVMLYKYRAIPSVLQYLDANPDWRRMMDSGGRVLYVTRASLAQRNTQTSLSWREQGPT